MAGPRHDLSSEPAGHAGGLLDFMVTMPGIPRGVGALAPDLTAPGTAHRPNLSARQVEPAVMTRPSRAALRRADVESGRTKPRLPVGVSGDYHALLTVDHIAQEEASRVVPRESRTPAVETQCAITSVRLRAALSRAGVPTVPHHRQPRAPRSSRGES